MMTTTPVVHCAPELRKKYRSGAPARSRRRPERITASVCTVYLSTLTRGWFDGVHGGGGEDHGCGGVHLYSLTDRMTMNLLICGVLLVDANTLVVVYSLSIPTSARWMTTGRKKKVADKSGWPNLEAVESGTARFSGGGGYDWILPDLGKKGHHIIDDRSWGRSPAVSLGWRRRVVLPLTISLPSPLQPPSGEQMSWRRVSGGSGVVDGKQRRRRR